MSFPKLTMRQVRKHPAVITNGDILRKGMEIATCQLWSPIGRGTRCAQALMSLVPDTGGERQHASVRERMREGYGHTPVWGIIMSGVATVNWVNRDNMMHTYPYASLIVSRSTSQLSLDESMRFRTTDVTELGMLAAKLPEVDLEDYYSEGRQRSFERISHFDEIGLAGNDPYRLQQFVVDLSKF